MENSTVYVKHIDVDVIKFTSRLSFPYVRNDGEAKFCFMRKEKHDSKHFVVVKFPEVFIGKLYINSY